MAMSHFVGGTTFNAATGEVCRDRTIRRLEPQPTLVLTLLIHRAGGLVTHDEIRHAVWGDETHVDFRDGVHYCIRRIRAALGDDARAPRIVTTVPRRGYRLSAEALLSPDPVLAPSSQSRPSERLSVPNAVVRPFGRRRHFVIAGLVAGLGIATAIVERRPNNHHDAAVAVLKAVHDFIY
jgi:DNA-binding winged helix-turn-helix (wHTH) protein